MRPIRILRIIARLNIGGPAIQASTLSARLHNDDYQTLLVCGNVAPGEGDMSYLALSEGIKPEVIPTLGREISFLDDLRSLRDLRKIIKKFKPHIIHTHTAKAGTLGRIAAIGLKSISGTPVRRIHTFHGHVFNGYFGTGKTALFVRIERWLARFTDRIVVISPLQMEDISLRYKIAPSRKVRIIPLGFDLAPFTNSRGEGEGTPCGRDKSNRVVGIVGRLTRIKNHQMFLDAVKIFKEADPVSAVRFLVVGDGELRQELEQYAHQLGVSRLVQFAGWQKDMPAIYRNMDAVVLTSDNEGTPVTLIEAMAAGVPVIATAVGGVPDLLGKKEEKGSGFQTADRGILIHPGDPKALADALIFVLKSPDASARMARDAREHVTRHYSIERLLGDIKVLYAEVLG